SRGIGQRLAVGMASAGASVFAVARGAEGLAETVAAAGAVGGTAVAHPADLLAEGAAESAVAAMGEALGGVDVVVNNAARPHREMFDETEVGTWRDVLEMNLRVPFEVCRHAGPHLRESGSGKVVNVASVFGLGGAQRNSAYISAKHGLVGFTKALAIEWARRGVQVNALAPGFVRTDMTAHAWGEDGSREWVERRTPMGRWGEPDDMVGAAIFL